MVTKMMCLSGHTKKEKYFTGIYYLHVCAYQVRYNGGKKAYFSGQLGLKEAYKTLFKEVLCASFILNIRQQKGGLVHVNYVRIFKQNDAFCCRLYLKCMVLNRCIFSPMGF